MKDIPPTVDSDDWIDFLVVAGIVSVPQSVVFTEEVNAFLAVSY